jgi:hypothetical protein
LILLGFAQQFQETARRSLILAFGGPGLNAMRAGDGV